MFNINTLREGAKIKESRSLLRIASNGQQKMYDYLSGADANSTYTAQNIKYIMEMHGDLDWNKVNDPSNALFSIGYSDQGNIIGLLTNTNALLQDMLIYSPLEEAKRNLREVLSIEVGTERIIGKRYAVNGKSPLTFALPLITKSHYKTFSVVIHKNHADRFQQIIKTIDIDALTKEDMILIAKDFGFISRTQELAIDVAKDKTIEIVDTSEWVNAGIKPELYWLSKQKTVNGWYAKENLSEIIQAKKQNKPMPDFEITKDIPEEVSSKVNKEVTTSESLARKCLVQATKDYFNDTYREMIMYSQETALNQRAKAKSLEFKELSLAIKQVLMAYRGFMIDNIPKENVEDIETAMFLRKLSKEKTNEFARICRNTIYKLGQVIGLNAYDIALIAYGTDLIEVSLDEGKYFRAIMPEEFKKLYAQGKTATSRTQLFFVDDFIKDMMDDGAEYVVDFVEGKAYDEDNNLIAKASYKYNSKNAKIVFEEESGRYYAEIEEGISLPPVGDDVLIRIENVNGSIESIKDIKLEYVPKSPNNRNLLIENDYEEKIIHGTLGYRTALSNYYRLMLLNNKALNNMMKENKSEYIDTILNSYERVVHYNLIKPIKINKIECVNKDNEYESNYAVISL